jgi:hypothetical protein
MASELNLITEGFNMVKAIAVPVEKFVPSLGPGEWWFVHHPDGFLLECASKGRAQQIAAEINAGRAALRGEGVENG